jgi:hypothetical protein
MYMHIFLFIFIGERNTHIAAEKTMGMFRKDDISPA